MPRVDPFAGMPPGNWIKRTILTRPFNPSSGPFTPHPLANFIRLRMLGGGGAGGGAASTSANVAVGGGGGAGGYIDIGFAVRAQDLSGGSYFYNIGAAGVPGTAGANTGGIGGDTGWFFNVGTFVAGGGSGGPGGASGTLLVIGGVGGAVANSYTGPILELPLLTVGQSGFHGIGMSAAASPAIGGYGGSTIFAGGGWSNVANSSQASTSGPTGYGAGGAGAANSGTQGALAGGGGVQGLIIVDEFS